MRRLLNTASFIDPFLLEARGYSLLNEGLHLHKSGDYDNALNKFYLAIRYISYPFRGVTVNTLSKAGVFLSNPFDDSNPFSSEHEEYEEYKLAIYMKKIESLKAIKYSEIHRANDYNEVISGLFTLSESRNTKILNVVLNLINEINNNSETTPLSFYIALKVLLCLDREEEFIKEFDRLYNKLEKKSILEIRNYASIRYFKLLRLRKENSLDYLISALEFFIAAPYSEATVSLLAKYQFNNHININYDKEVLPKIIKFEEKKNFPVLYNFKRLLSHFTNVYVIGSNKDLFFEAGDAYKSLINYIEPQKSSYQSLKLLKLFYFLMYRNLLKLKELRESEFRKNNPDYNEDDYYDYDDSEPYTHDDFINDVFEGDESYGWNID